MYNLHFMLLNVCIYNIYKASVSQGLVQQIMPYFGSLRYNGSLDT
jgi:hypothetical protein